MSKKCFVIMPYGKTELERREYSKIYRSFIKPSVEEAGLECVRSDLNAKGGHIFSNVIEDLATSDIVIADLSDLNWNVAYELGIRHVFHKNGTILICNSEQKQNIPFDIQSLDIFFYSPLWHDRVDEMGEILKKRIRGRLDGSSKVDSPIHEKYSYLPENVLLAMETVATTDDSLKAAKKRIAELEKDLSAMQEKIDAAGLSVSGDSGVNNVIDFEQVFNTELANSIYYSDNAVAKLRELCAEEKKEELVSFLAKVLSVGFLDEFDCRSVYQLCNRLGIPSITRVYLEQVVKFYPENEELSSLLANEYSKNYHTGEKAIQMVNDIIGVVRKDGKYALAQTAGKITTSKLGSFFDVYLHLHKYQDLVAVGILLCERYQGNDKIMPMVLRNMALSYIYLDDLDNARSCKEQLMSIAPLRDTTHWLAMKYEDAVENYEQVVEELENCILLDDEDVDYYISMAGYICDNLYVRDPETLTIKKITIKEADQYAVPFLLTALDIDRSCINRVIDFLRRNKFGTYIQDIVDAYQEGVSSFREAFEEINYNAVNYCFGKTI